jgi:hypothetical protein
MTTRASPEMALARLELPGTVLPRSTMPVDSSQRKACAMPQPSQPSPTITRPSSLAPQLLLRNESQGFAPGWKEPSSCHSRPPRQMAAFWRRASSNAVPKIVAPSPLTASQCRAPVRTTPLSGVQ